MKIGSEAVFSSPAVIAAFSRRPHNMSFCHGLNTEYVLSNRKVFLESLDISPQHLVCAKQIHDNSVMAITQEHTGRGAFSHETALTNTDAFVTNVRGIPLSILTADCLSIFFFDPVNKAIGIAHAGWKGTRTEIALKTIKLMQREYKSSIADIVIGFGPAIRSCCYEVGAEFADYFSNELVRRQNRYYLDIVGANRRQLLGLGIKKENINDCGICTSCKHMDFFSYRKEKENAGRMISVIMLR